jgi:hypothetical protein
MTCNTREENAAELAADDQRPVNSDRMTPKTCPAFDRYTCIGDTRTWTREGFTLTATVHPDTDTKPTDFDCYSDDQIAAWAADEWMFVGLIVTVCVVGVKLTDTSLWGIDCNFPRADGSRDNSYLSEVADELAEEAMHDARVKARDLIDTLSNLTGV